MLNINIFENRDIDTFDPWDLFNFILTDKKNNYSYTEKLDIIRKALYEINFYGIKLKDILNKLEIKPYKYNNVMLYLVEFLDSSSKHENMLSYKKYFNILLNNINGELSGIAVDYEYNKNNIITTIGIDVNEDILNMDIIDISIELLTVLDIYPTLFILYALHYDMRSDEDKVL